MSRVRSSYTLPPLEPGSCLLLHPEDVNGETEGAFYAAVTSVRQTSVEIRVIGETEVAQHTIPRSLANARRVQPEEATAEGPGTWLRKAVVTEYRVQFDTHPGAVGRMYDLRFGRGLSIKHFRRVSFLDKLRNSGIDSTDFAAAAPNAAEPSSWADLGSTTRSFANYCREMCDCSAQIPFFTIHSDGLQRFQLDRAAQTTLTTLSTAHDFTVQALVKLMRGQTSSDYLPNKTLCPLRLAALLHGYKHCQLVCSVASREIAPQWKSTAPPLAAITKNHQSANRHLNPVVKSVRKGQDARQYLVLVDTVTSHVVGVHVSPLGAVENKDTNPRGDVRLIHALSSPGCPSVNYASDKEYFPAIKYRHVAAIARRIEYLAKLHPGQVSHILKGDVKTAFRHLMLESSTVSRMGARIPQLQALVLDCSIRMERFAVVLRRIW
ncbi:hypothetical protein PC111_g19996 [Phytophthora cactorum]|nr:hypothetical protein PC111_g19996 [Phytophthora cactorum]